MAPMARSQTSSPTGGWLRTCSTSHPGTVNRTTPEDAHNAACQYRTRLSSVMARPILAAWSARPARWEDARSELRRKGAGLLFATTDRSGSRGMTHAPRVAVIGLDCCTPQLLF